MTIITPSNRAYQTDEIINSFSFHWYQNADGFVADRVFPVLETKNFSGQYVVYDRGSLNRDEMQERGYGSESAKVTTTHTTANYDTRAYALSMAMDLRIMAQMADTFDVENEMVENLMHKYLIKKDRLWAQNFFQPVTASGVTWAFVAEGVATGETAENLFDPTSGTNNKKRQWNDALSNPIADIRQAKTRIMQATGKTPNKLVLNQYVYDVLLEHPDIIDRLNRGQTSGPAKASRESLAALFELEEIVVMSAVFNASGLNSPEDSRFIGGKHALLVYVPATTGLYTPSAGITFQWVSDPLVANLGAGLSFRRWEHEPTNTFHMEINANFSQKLTAAELGYQFTNIIA
jgi:hypothetical protein